MPGWAESTKQFRAFVLILVPTCSWHLAKITHHLTLVLAVRFRHRASLHLCRWSSEQETISPPARNREGGGEAEGGRQRQSNGNRDGRSEECQEIYFKVSCTASITAEAKIPSPRPSLLFSTRRKRPRILWSVVSPTGPFTLSGPRITSCASFVSSQHPTPVDKRNPRVGTPHHNNKTNPHPNVPKILSLTNTLPTVAKRSCGYHRNSRVWLT